MSDSGNIKCVANNLLGKAASNAQLMIESKLFNIYSSPYFMHYFIWFVNKIYLLFYLPCITTIHTAPPRFDVPESYTDGLIFRHEEVIRLKVPLVAKPAPKVNISRIRYTRKLQIVLIIFFEYIWTAKCNGVQYIL